MSPAPRFDGIELAHRGRPMSRLTPLSSREQRAIALGRRHRRIAVLVEADLGVRAGERLGDDRAHLGAGAVDLVLADRAQVAARDRGRGDDVGLAGRLQPDLAVVELRRLAAADQSDIVGQLVLGKLAAELVDDPRQLVDRAIVAPAPTPAECALWPVTVSVQLPALRRAIEPMSVPVRPDRAGPRNRARRRPSCPRR